MLFSNGSRRFIPGFGQSAGDIYVHGDCVAEPAYPIQNIVFPRSGMSRWSSNFPDGDGVASAMIGHHIAVGLGAAFGSRTYININIAQSRGDGWSLSVPEMMRAVEADASWGPLLFCCQEYLLAQAQHTAACNAKHHLGRRLASWFLRAEDACGHQDVNSHRSLWRRCLACSVPQCQ